MEFKVPESMQMEHQELHTELLRATQSPGRVGEAARAVADILHPHFEKEEAYALPPLGLLSPLARGELKPEMADVLTMTDRLKSELPEMLAEHQAIVAALDRLIEAAREEGQDEYARFAEKLILHAQTEEQVSYPASILVGEYLKLKLNRAQ